VKSVSIKYHRGHSIQRNDAAWVATDMVKIIDSPEFLRNALKFLQIVVHGLSRNPISGKQVFFFNIAHKVVDNAALHTPAL